MRLLLLCPSRIVTVRSEQIKLAREILAEKLAQAEVYRTLYQPAQHFIDSHQLAKDKLRLEFRAELTNEDFEDRLLGLIAQNRRGTFMGSDEGRAKAGAWTETANWANTESVIAFIYASMDKPAGNEVTYITGALENSVISKHVTDVLEGTRWAFGVRRNKYDIIDAG